MRRSFQLWLFVSVALAFAALFYLTYYLQTKEAFGSAEAMIELRMDDAKKQIAINENNLKAVLDICNASMANDAPSPNPSSTASASRISSWSSRLCPGEWTASSSNTAALPDSTTKASCSWASPSASWKGRWKTTPWRLSPPACASALAERSLLCAAKRSSAPPGSTLKAARSPP